MLTESGWDRWGPGPTLEEYCRVCPILTKTRKVPCCEARRRVRQAVKTERVATMLDLSGTNKINRSTVRRREEEA
jgi:hypothetical protein